MSLYEQYNSELNKNYMKELIVDVLKKEVGFDLSTDDEYSDYYNREYDRTFTESNNVEDLRDINKILLDKHVSYFVDKYNKIPSTNVTDDYNQLIQEREDFSSTPIEQIIPQRKEMTTTIESIPIESSKEVKIETYKTFHMGSFKRSNTFSSRYNYKIDLTKNKKQSSDIHYIEKIIIPLEDNFLFSQPILSVSIPELSYETHLELDNTMQTQNRSFGVYKNKDISTQVSHELLDKEHSKITIDIRDIGDNKYPSQDIVNVNVIEIVNVKSSTMIIFTCSKIEKGDYMKGDYIKIINNLTKELKTLLKEPFKIEKIKKNQIYCLLDLETPMETTKYDSIDMKLINMSHQNMVYFK